MVWRVGVHKLYHVFTGRVDSYCVIEFDGDSVVCNVYSLTEEIEQTEWLGGMAIVSPFFLKRKAEETFASFCKRMKEAMEKNDLSAFPVKAYYVFPFNLIQMEFDKNSRITLLSGEILHK